MKRRTGLKIAAPILVLLGLVSGGFVLAEPRSGQQYPKPIPMGTSCGNWQSSPYLYAGTCGLRVRFAAAPQYVGILSNNHVLGAAGQSLCPGSAVRGQTLTLQPGTLDIGSIPSDPSPYAVGKFGGAVPINFSGGDNYVDCAVSFTTTALSSASILNLGAPTQAITTPAPGMQVTKTGRTTDTTSGTIQTISTTVLVNYGAGCGTARFVGQIVITPGTFSSGGDSGSAILEQSTRIPVGLLFAGSSASTIANDIRLVYRALGVYPDADATSAADTAAVRSALLADTHAGLAPDLRRAEEVRARVEARIFSDPEVVGLGVFLDADGSRPALVVFSRELREDTGLEARLPRDVDGIPLRVVRSGPFDAYRW